MEENVMGKTKPEIEVFCGKMSEQKYTSDVWQYVLKRYCFGLISVKIHLYFDKKERVRDFYIGY